MSSGSLNSKEEYAKLNEKQQDKNENNNGNPGIINETISEITNLTTQSEHLQVIISGLKNKQPEQPLQFQENNQLIDYYPEENDEQDVCSIAKHHTIGYKARILIPIFLFLNTVMFIYCNIDKGALVQIQLKLFGFQTEPQTISSFSLYGSINMMIKSGAVPTAILMFLFSGLWPYVKIIGMYVCWFTPQNYLSFKKRDTFLTILDILGKWSLIDTYFMVNSIVAMKVDINVQDFYQKLNVSFNVTCSPLFDFLCYLLATMLSLVLTHFMLYYHRKTVEKEKEDSLELTEKLNEKVAFGQKNKFMRYFGPFVVLLGMILSVLGYFLDTSIFNVEGLAGWAMGENAYQNYSFWSTTEQFPYKTYDPNSVAVRLIQACVFSFTFILPMVFFILIGTFYTVPIKLRYQQKLYFITEILYSWSSIDVASVALVTVVFQTRLIAVYNIGKNCDGINQVIELLVKLDPTFFNIQGSNTCFDISTSLTINSAFLFSATFIFMYAGTQPLRGIQEELETRLEQCGQRKISVSNYQKKYSIKHLNKSQIKDIQQPLNSNDSESNKENQELEM